MFNSLIKDKLNELGNNGCSKADILELLDMFIKITSNKEDAIPFGHFLDNIKIGGMKQFMHDVWGRKHKNDMWKDINIRYERCLDYARKAHKWATGKDDFSNEAYECDEYYDEIIEYRNYMED